MNEIIEVKPISVKKIEKGSKEVTALLLRAENVKVSNGIEATNASGFIREIKNMWKKRNEERKTISVPMDVAKKAIQALFVPGLNALNEAEKIIKSKMVDYSDEQEKIRRKQEEKIRQEAAREEERKRKALEARAKKAEEQGKAEKAEELREQKDEVKVIAPTLAPTPKPQGISYLETWKGVVTDFSKLSDKFKAVNQSALNGVAKSTKGQQDEPGVKWVCEKTVRSY